MEEHFVHGFTDEIEKIARAKGVGKAISKWFGKYKKPLAVGAAGTGIGGLAVADPVGKDIALQKEMKPEEARKILKGKPSYTAGTFPGTRGFQRGRRQRAVEVMLSRIGEKK